MKTLSGDVREIAADVQKNMKKLLHSTYRALDTIIRDHFVDFVASV